MAVTPVVLPDAALKPTAGITGITMGLIDMSLNVILNFSLTPVPPVSDIRDIIEVTLQGKTMTAIVQGTRDTIIMQSARSQNG